MTEQEKKRLKELVAKKKSSELTEAEKAELEALNTKAGYKKGKGKGTCKENPPKKKEFTPGNDFSWWNKEETLTRDCANFKSNYVAGRAIADVDIPYVVPGVVTITLESVYGSDNAATDGINVWARDLYLRMFQKYRPASSYDAADLGITLIAENEVVKMVAKYERIYGVINRYSRINVNMPNVEADALGLSATDLTYLQSHLSDFRYDLNFLLKKAQRLCIPKDMSIIADAISLFGYEYLDHDSPRSQIIIFDLNKVGLYDETAVTSGGAIYFADIDSSNPLFDFNADNMCKQLDDALNALLGSDSVQRILADLVVWFGEGAMLQFNAVPEDYVVLPTYSESMLHKMHNLETLANFSDHIVSWADGQLSTADMGIITNGLHWVYQVNGRIVTRVGVEVSAGSHSPIAYDNGVILSSNSGYTPMPSVCRIIDTYRAEVTPETLVEGALFKFTSTAHSSGGNSVQILTSCCFYIARNIVLYTNGSSSAYITNIVANDAVTAQATAGALAVLDWAPLSYNLNTSNRFANIYGDLDNVVPMYRNDLSRIQRTIVLSGMKTDVPVVNK